MSSSKPSTSYFLVNAFGFLRRLALAAPEVFLGNEGLGFADAALTIGFFFSLFLSSFSSTKLP